MIDKSKTIVEDSSSYSNNNAQILERWNLLTPVPQLYVSIAALQTKCYVSLNVMGLLKLLGVVI